MNKSRLYVGVVLVGIAAVLPFISVPLISMSPLSTAAKATAITIMVAGAPEVILLLAGVVMGKDNLSKLVKRLLSPVKSALDKLKQVLHTAMHSR
ncbi:hypothetical protein BCU70_10145 [Vibrio sp. 10N.286.49.C2]|uniref:transporter suffix domain-containing protein n=1 Tax=unclassified Vibrio TaxID=2614977 RepID=UPI000C85F467|nr:MULTISPECIES: transporter suffix domain-containing protein [unclassified Vibrio]PMH26497.1 hypothetical protein BCU70_10145 [Vibrio sp. 10N.286.49.C2]PMH54779.1 hypothetical protein BCU66_10790 [Vibrio sp. 10N.286.49.B1]PMH82520.1 hypothetical protein BCU58_18015 [Vibrio sp. 10N.286.48.B7]